LEGMIGEHRAPSHDWVKVLRDIDSPPYHIYFG
jgi:hypothetical protein